MRISLMAATAALLLTAAPASALQDTPSNQNGIETVCTGVGSAKDDPRWSAYPVKIVLATAGGHNLANAHVTLARGGQALVQTECDAPWILFKVPAGSYIATATLIGGSGKPYSANFTSTGHPPQKEITLTFGEMAPAPTR
jgi:hypothetical protein